MYNTFELFIPENASGNLFYVIYFMLAWLGCDMLCWHFILILSSGTCVMCKLDMDMYIVWTIGVYLVPYFRIALANFDAC